MLQASDDSEVVLGEATLSLALAHLGALDEADDYARQALERAQPHPYRLITARGAAGFVAVSQGEYAVALEHLTPAREALVRLGFLEFSAGDSQRSPTRRARLRASRAGRSSGSAGR